jgi:broad specificity phosphatase PhoE
MPIPPISRTLLAVVRHGRTAWNEAGLIQGRSDQPLSPAGIDEVERLLPQLATTKWDLVVTSPLVRAQQTGKIIADHFGCPSCEDERLTERAYGPAEGLSIDEAKAQYPTDVEISSSLRQIGLGPDVPDERISTGSVRFISYQDGRFEQVSM